MSLGNGVKNKSGVVIRTGAVVLSLSILAMFLPANVWAGGAPGLMLEPGVKQVGVSWSASLGHSVHIVQWKRGGPSTDPATLIGNPSPRWWFFNNTHIFDTWGSGRYAEIRETTDGWWHPVVWLPDQRVDGPNTRSLREAQLWAEHIIDNYWNWDPAPRPPSPGWFVWKGTYVLGQWGSGEYAEIRKTKKGLWHPKVWLPDQRVDGPATRDLQEAQLWAEGTIDEADKGKKRGSVVYEMQTDKMTYTITGLANATEYTVRVKAFGKKNGTVPAWVTTTSAPDAPSPVIARSPLEVMWAAPYDGGSEITLYQVRIWQPGKESVEEAPQGAVNGAQLIDVLPNEPGGWVGRAGSYVLTGIEDDVQYAIQVRARNAAGYGPWSYIAHILPYPGVPRVYVAGAGMRELILAWGEPESNGAAVSGYQVEGVGHNGRWLREVSLEGGGTLDEDVLLDDGSVLEAGTSTYRYYVQSRWDHPAAPGADPKIVIHNGVTYSIKVRAVARYGDISLYGPWSATTHDIPGPSPLPPAYFDAIPGDQEVTVNWTPRLYPDPADNLIGTDSYTVQWRSEDQEYHEDRQAETNEVPYTITGLANSSLYLIRVKAHNSSGSSPWSDEWAWPGEEAKEWPVSTIWPPVPPAQPHVTLGDKSSNKEKQLVVTWSEPPDGGGAITGYTVRWQKVFSPSGTPSGQWKTIADPNEYTLQEGIELFPGIYRITKYGEVKRNSEDTLWVSYASIKDAGDFYGPATDSLDEAKLWVEYVFRNPDFETVHETVTSDTAYTITGLSVDTFYEVRVKATNAAGDSDWSPGTPPGTAVLPPGAPTVHLKPSFAPGGGANSGRIRASWSEPPNNGGAITEYTIQWGTKSDPTAVTTTDTSYLITGLSPGRKYYVRVRATNIKGDGEWSQWRRRKTPGYPNVPRISRIYPTITTLRVDFYVPEDNGAHITHYVIQWRWSATLDWTSANEMTLGYTHGWTDSFKLTGLWRMTPYEVRIRAVNGVGTSWWSTGKKETRNDPYGWGRSGSEVEVSLTGDWIVWNGTYILAAEEWGDGYAEVKPKGGNTWRATAWPPDGERIDGPTFTELVNAQFWAEDAIEFPPPVCKICPLAKEKEEEEEICWLGDFIDGRCTPDHTWDAGF